LLSEVLATVTYAQTSPSSSTSCSKGSIVVNFDPKKGQLLPEGLDSNNKGIFVSWTPIGKVAKMDKGSLTVSDYGTWLTIPPNKGIHVGIEF
jgi:hypothetical protein